MFFRQQCTRVCVCVCVCVFAGAIAAALFISFLLALYAVLWKCMVTQPKRYELNNFHKVQVQCLFLVLFSCAFFVCFVVLLCAFCLVLRFLFLFSFCFFILVVVVVLLLVPKTLTTFTQTNKCCFLH